MAKRKNVDSSKKDEVEVLQKLSALTDELLTVQEKLKKLSTDDKKNLEEIKKTREEERDLLKEQKKLEEQLEVITENRVQNSFELQSMADKYLESLLEHKLSMESISATGKAVMGDTDYTAKLYDGIANVMESNVSLHERQGSLSREYLTILQENAAYSERSRDIQKDILADADKAARGEYVKRDLSHEQLELKKSQQMIEISRDKMTSEEASKLQSIIGYRSEALESTIKMNDALNEASRSSERVLGVFNSVVSMDIKGAMKKGFALDEIEKGVKDKLGGALVNITKEIRGGGGIVGGFKMAMGVMGDLIKMGPKLLAGLGIGAIVAAFGFIMDAIGDLDSAASELGKEFGISRKEAIELHKNAVDIASEMNIVGINAKEIGTMVKSLGDVSTALGGLDIGKQLASGNQAVKQLVKDTAVLTNQFGLSAEEAAAIGNLSTMTGKSMGQLTAEATKLGNGLMTSKESLKTLAKIPPSVTVAFKGGTQELIKAAQKAKLLGMELGKVQGIGDGMLDIESSLQKEMEARAILGRDINLDAARAAALNGDVATLQDEILKQAGSLADFQKMNRIQQKAFADAMGMSVDEMTNMLTNAQSLKDLGIDQNKMDKLHAMNAAELNKEMQKGGSAQYTQYLQKLAKEKESAALNERMADVMSKLKDQISKLVAPLLEMVHAFFDSAEGAGAIEGFMQGAQSVIKITVPIVKLLFSTLSYILKPLVSILSLFSSTKDVTEQVAGVTGSVADGTSKIAEGAKNVLEKTEPLQAGFGNVLTVLMGIGAFFSGKAILGKGMDMLTGKVGEFGKSIISNMSNPLSKVGGKLTDTISSVTSKIPGASKLKSLTSSVTGKLGGGATDKIADVAKASPGGKLGSAVEDVSKSAKEAQKGENIISSTLDKIKTTIDSAKDVVRSLIKFVRDIAKELMTAVKELLKGLSDVLNSAIDLIKSVGNNLLKTISELIQSIGGVLNSVVDVVRNVGTNLFKTLDDLVKGVGNVLKTGADIIVSVGGKLADGAVKILNTLMQGLAQAAKTLPGIMGSLGSAVVSFFTPMAALVAPPVIAGILVFTAAMIGLGFAFKLLGEGIGAAAPGIMAFFDGAAVVIQQVGESISTVIETITESVIRLQNIDGSRLLLTASGIAAIGVSLAAFGGGSAIAGIGSAIGSFFGGDGPIDQVIKITEKIKPDILTQASNSIRNLADSFSYFAENISKMTNIDLSKIDEILEKMEKVNSVNSGGVAGAVGSAIGGAVSSVSSAIGSFFGSDDEDETPVKNQTPPAVTIPQQAQPINTGGGGQTVNMANVEKKLDTLISVISQAANQPTIIKFNDKVVDEIKSAMNFKGAYQIGIDNTYGRSI
ncbi:hypothetical protein [Microcystis phage Mel-JY01]